MVRDGNRYARVRCWANGSPSTIRDDGIWTRNERRVVSLHLDSDVGSVCTSVCLDATNARRLAKRLNDVADRIDALGKTV